MDAISVVSAVFVGLIFAFIGTLLLVNQANTSLKSVPAWITVPFSSVFFSVAAGFWTTVFGPSWVQNAFPELFWMYVLGLNLPCGVYWFFANRNPNKSKFVQAIAIAW